jgi:hypothetical protein
MNISRFSWVIVALAVGNVSCGGGDDSGSTGATTCTQMSACGGDIKGDWNVVAACIDQAALADQAQQICEAATLTSSVTSVSGTISYKADNTFVQGASTAAGTVDLVLPASCLKQGGVTLTCPQIQGVLNKDTADAPWTCASSNGGCKCSEAPQLSAMSTGTYSVSDKTVTLTSTATATMESTTVVQDYCIVGSKLYLLPTADSPLPAQLQFNRK